MRKLFFLGFVFMSFGASAQYQKVFGQYSYQDSARFSKYKNNGAQDSVLTTDSLGTLKLKKIATSGLSQIYNIGSGYKVVKSGDSVKTFIGSKAILLDSLTSNVLTFRDSANNGLNVNTSAIKLGGTLTDTGTVIRGNKKNLTIDSMNHFVIGTYDSAAERSFIDANGERIIIHAEEDVNINSNQGVDITAPDGIFLHGAPFYFQNLVQTGANTDSVLVAYSTPGTLEVRKISSTVFTNKVDSLYKNASRDSLVFTINGRRHALKDSTGSSGYTPSGTTGYYPYYSSSSTLSGTGPMYTDGSGKVGVGTTSPGSTLDVFGPSVSGGANIQTRGDVMIGTTSGATIFFGGTYSYASGDYVRQLAGVGSIGIYTLGTAALVANNGAIGIGTATPSQALDVVGNIKASGSVAIGTKLLITTGTNASAGTATLVGGTVTVSTTAVTSSSLIFLTDATTGALTNIGTPTVGTKTAGTSFVINSSNPLDTSNINWLIIN